MNTAKHNVIKLSAKFVKANCAPSEACAIPPSLPEVNKAIEDLRHLWSATDGLLRSSRDALYEFLGVTYELAKVLGADTALVQDLRHSIRGLYTSDKDKTAVAKKTVTELLLAASMGTKKASASLRSKYERILRSASTARVAPDRDSFKLWLTKNGGIVNALKAAVDTLEPTDSADVRKPRSIDSAMSDLIAQYAQLPKEHRGFASSYKGFTVVLYYTKSGTTGAARIAELADRSVVERAISDAYKALPKQASTDQAA